MNWKRESEQKETLTRAGFDRLVKDITAAIAEPKLDGTKVLAVLRERFAMDGDIDCNPFHGEDVTTWEHPELTRHNRACGSRGILNQGFFTLYSRVVDYDEHSYTFAGEVNVIPAYSMGYVQFVLGRVGNTFSVGRSYNITADCEPATEEPQGLLFGTE